MIADHTAEINTSKPLTKGMWKDIIRYFRSRDFQLEGWCWGIGLRACCSTPTHSVRGGCAKGWLNSWEQRMPEQGDGFKIWMWLVYCQWQRGPEKLKDSPKGIQLLGKVREAGSQMSTLSPLTSPRSEVEVALPAKQGFLCLEVDVWISFTSVCIALD